MVKRKNGTGSKWTRPDGKWVARRSSDASGKRVERVWATAEEADAWLENKPAKTTRNKLDPTIAKRIDSMIVDGVDAKVVADVTGVHLKTVRSRLYKHRHGAWAKGRWVSLDDVLSLVREAYESGEYALGIDNLIADIEKRSKK
jgi:hypothetical protein